MMRSFGVPFIAFCLILFSSNAFGNSAKQIYDKALQLEKTLKGSERLQRNLSEWNKVVNSFRSVYYKYPSSGYSDNALFHAASLYGEMGRKFQDKLYWRRACSTYSFLIEQYSSSSLIDDAMLEYIRIMKNELNQSADARTMEQRLKARFPKLASKTPTRPVSTSSSHQTAVLTMLRHYTGTDYTRIVLDLDQEVSFRKNRLSAPDRIYIDFDNTLISKDLLKLVFPVDDGFLKQIRIGQNTEKRARVVLDLKSIENFEIFALYHPYRVVVDIQGKKSAAVVEPAVETKLPEIPLAPPEMAKSNSNGKYSLARQLGLKVRTIVVDPGHGGHDPGAMRDRLKEKEITLDVSLRLRKLLEEEYGYEVLMTRETDRFIPLEERTAYANSKRADLFVSVHVNSSRNRAARGVETYYLNFATTPEAMEVAARENAIAEKNMGELQKLTTAIAMNSKIEESRDFANLIQANLVQHLKKGYSINNLGVKQAPFYVLIGAHMPSILAEISFMSNYHELELLRKSSYRQSVAEGLARGIQGYIQTLAESKTAMKLEDGR